MLFEQSNLQTLGQELFKEFERLSFKTIPLFNPHEILYILLEFMEVMINRESILLYISKIPNKLIRINSNRNF